MLVKSASILTAMRKNNDELVTRYRLIVSMIAEGKEDRDVYEPMGISKQNYDNIIIVLRKRRDIEIYKKRGRYRLYTPIAEAIDKIGSLKPKPRKVIKKKDDWKKHKWSWWGFITHDSEIEFKE